MSGHSKWATIKRKKGAQDARRGKVFTKLIREIANAARLGGPDPAGNPRLRLAIDKARGSNMPKDNIERAIRKGSGEGGGEQYEEVVYEGYGPGGTAILLEVLTDNRNRTASAVRHLFSKHRGSLGESGCVAYLFDKKGVISIARKGLDLDALYEAALDAGAEDVVESEETVEVLCEPSAFESVRAALVAKRFPLDAAEVTQRPSNTVELRGAEAESVLALADALEELDDVQNVYANFDIPDEEMAKIA